MAQQKVGMPSVSGVQDAMINYAVGLGGGLVYSIASSFSGSGLLGGLLSAGLAGSVIKGTRGTAIATILGFQTIVSGIQPQNVTDNATPSVM